MAPSVSLARAPARAAAGKADWAAVARASGPGGRSRKSDARGVLSQAEMTSRIGQLGDMGFSEAASRRALEQHGWNVNSALDQLFLQGDVESGASEASPTAALPAQASKLAQAGEEPATRCPSDATSQMNSQEGSGDERSPLSDRTPSSRELAESPSEAVGQLQAASAGLACEAEASPEPAEELRGAERRLELDEAAGAAEEPCSSGLAHKATPALEEATAASPPRQLWRVQRDWAEEDAGKLAVQRGSVVYIWPGTETELGWAYGELAVGASGAGWFPLSIVERLPDGQLVLQARRSVVSSFENQLPMQEGAGYLVDAASRTSEGWTYATELLSDASGWVPTAALAWPAGLS